MPNDDFAEWPPPHYYSPSEAELAELFADDDEIEIGTAGLWSGGYNTDYSGAFPNGE